VKKKFKIKIIAEAGVNHNGSIKLAKRLIDVAKKAKCDYVKFQAFKAEELVTLKAKKTSYQKVNQKDHELQFKMLKKLEFSENDFIELKKYCKKKKIKFLCTAFDTDFLSFLVKLKIDIIKIPSGEINNIFLLKKAAEFKKPILLSTGASTIKDIKFALKIIKKKRNKIYLMQCSSAYPTPVEHSNINTIKEFSRLADGTGFSDHTLNNEPAIVAIALGAEYIEKHFTLNRKMRGPDHKASLNPKQLELYVESLRNAELSLGKKFKMINKLEKKNYKFIRRVVVARRKIKINEKFTIQNLTIKRSFLSNKRYEPKDLLNLINKKSNKNYKTNEEIQK
jgi:N,N'-diacetyllegionaminate synthase